MGRVFLMCVGTRDPQWASAQNGTFVPFSRLPENATDVRSGPILSFFNLFYAAAPGQGTQDRVYLFSTQPGPNVRDPTEKGGEQTRELLTQKFPWLDVVHRRFPSDVDPSEFPEVVNALDRLVETVVGENPSADLIVNVSPGTPQMQAAWYALAHAGRLRGTLYRIITDPSSRRANIVPVDLMPFAVTDLKQRAVTAFEGSYFREAARLFRDLAGKVAGPLLRRTEVCAELCETYAAWVGGSRQDALKRVKKIRRVYKDILGAFAGLSDHAKTLEQKLGEPMTLRLHLADFYQEGRRRLAQGEHIDAFWRAGTVVERIEIELARRCGFEGDERWQAHLFINSKKKDHAIPSADEKWLFRKRNEVVHRGSPVSEQEARRGLDLAREALVRLFPDLTGELDDHPLADERVSRAADLLDELVK